MFESFYAIDPLNILMSNKAQVEWAGRGGGCIAMPEHLLMSSCLYLSSCLALCPQLFDTLDRRVQYSQLNLVWGDTLLCQYFYPGPRSRYEHLYSLSTYRKMCPCAKSVQLPRNRVYSQSARGLRAKLPSNSDYIQIISK